MPAGSIQEGLSQAKEIIGKYPREQRFLLAALQDIQKEYNYLPREALALGIGEDFGLWVRWPGGGEEVLSSGEISTRFV